MKKKQQVFEYEVYDSIDQLDKRDAALLAKARKVTEDAYAPYSHFHVGAAGLLANGEVVTGTNQENASYPVGICSERVLLSAVAARFPGAAIDTLAISYDNRNGSSGRPVSPCGICRQSLQEYEQRTGKAIRIILSGQEGAVYVIPSADSLLPLSFGGGDMA